MQCSTNKFNPVGAALLVHCFGGGGSPKNLCAACRLSETTQWVCLSPGTYFFTPRSTRSLSWVSSVTWSVYTALCWNNSNRLLLTGLKRFISLQVESHKRLAALPSQNVLLFSNLRTSFPPARMALPFLCYCLL